MNCLSLEQMYLYLEQELSSVENKNIEDHLAACSKCQNALEERRILMEAAVSLPPFEVPRDFAQEVMARIFQKKSPRLGWLIATVISFASLVLVLVIFTLATKQNLSTLFVRLNYRLWNYVQDISLFFAKFFKFLLLFIKILGQLFGELLKSISFLTELIPWEVPFILFIFFLLILIAVSLIGRRRPLTGEKP